MDVELRTVPVEFPLHGIGLVHDPAKKFGEEIGILLGRVWPILRAGPIPNDGLSRVVYDRHGENGPCTLFAGVVLTGDSAQAAAAGLERRVIRLDRHAYWKHVGPYHLIPVTGSAMTKSLETRHGLRQGWPMVEVYGHWQKDESRLETETFVAVR